MHSDSNAIERKGMEGRAAEKAEGKQLGRSLASTDRLQFNVYLCLRRQTVPGSKAGWPPGRRVS